MGFTLRAALDALPGSARVVVAELVPDIIEWNRGLLATLAGRPLDDVRVEVHCGDVFEVLDRGRFDAILLDIDNGPAMPIYRDAPRVYESVGLTLARNSLTADGTLAIWSADTSEKFEAAMTACGLAWRSVDVLARDEGPFHTIYLARRNAAMVA